METKNWYAWIDTMPPKPHTLYVIGEILIDPLGVTPKLFIKEPQGINPSILLLDLRLVPLTPLQGATSSPAAWIPCRFEKTLTPSEPRYSEVEVFFDGEKIAHIKEVPIVS